MKNYVAGFLFDKSRSTVALIEKVRPEWQRGKLNGIGGHIEEGETPESAMCREFREETGVEIDSWEKFCILEGDDFAVHFFRAFSDQIINVISITDEIVDICKVDGIQNVLTIPNLRWLIPMARYIERDGVNVYHVREACLNNSD